MKHSLLLSIIVMASIARAADFSNDLWSQELFAGDLILPFTGVGPYNHAKRPYLDSTAIPEKANAVLRALKIGMTRAECKDWTLNSGLTLSEYCGAASLPDGRKIAVRMGWRPAAMPETVYSDSGARRAWIHDHKPDQEPTDILMKFSRPFASQRAID